MRQRRRANSRILSSWSCLQQQEHVSIDSNNTITARPPRMRAIHSPVEPLLFGSLSRIHLTLNLNLTLTLNSNLNFTRHGRRPRHGTPHQHTTPAIAVPHRRCLSSAVAEPKPSPNPYDKGLRALLAALRQNDSLKLYFCLMHLTRGAHVLNRDFSAAVYQIQPTTFSEIIRAFDPFTVLREVDASPGLRISYGASIHTPLGELVNKWGVKVLYVKILRRLMLLYHARSREARITHGTVLRPLPNDYRILIRCAGATSDIKLAKAFYRQMRVGGYISWIHSEMYTDFVKAWYLTEPLYTRHDLSAVRLRPQDMHLELPRAIIRRLHGVDINTTRLRPDRFGQMVRRRYYAESVRKILRLRKPLDGLMKAALARHDTTNEDEKLICTFIIANGRNGRLDVIDELLEKYWGIIVRREAQDNKMVYHISGGFTDIPRESCLAPTEVLLEAVVHGYGNSGEAQLAGDLMQYISKQYAIPVPSQVWSDLLVYARIHRSRPACQEWRMARLLHKITHKDYIFELWQAAAQTFEPRVEDYIELLKDQADGGRSHLLQAWNFELVRQVKPLYVALTRQLQTAWVDLMHTTRQGLPNLAAYRRYRVLQSRKYYAWHGFHYVANRILKHTAPVVVNSPLAVRYIPDLVRDLNEFMPLSITYRIATGVVELHLGQVEWREVQNQVQVVENPFTFDDADMAQMRYLPSNELDQKLGQALEKVAKEEVADELADEVDNKLDDKFDDDREEQVRHIKLRSKNPIQVQSIERPAIGPRPPGMAPAGQISAYSLRRDGKVFTGFHDNPRAARFAAHWLRLKVQRPLAMPVNLDPKQSEYSALTQLMRIRR